ncbi:SMC-Scp complex subunit ScpB [Edaphobacter sp. 12200R-103]|uniref:SMC-Scp complex subunit ScpB n=1 Tax=Edaphobacter sp. 12200R-103 TaxID=2703788 RepID=UPI00138C5C77|nr:SMC-Scp complex subunit ScpB [Edaphobacter sp. 12200R-103]QHS51994.1 SMC-Scp complex subunit ScpB [Edaphobacter sp. 12200R-103]
MSLKAKIEAVIYASEEPVTLSQLMGLLGQEAQAELDQIAQAQQALALEGEEQNSDESSSEANDARDTDVEGLNEEIVDSDETSPDDASAPGPEGGAEPVTEAAESHQEMGSFPEEVATAAATESSQDEEEAETPGRQSAREAKEEKERNRKLREYFRSILDQLIVEYANDHRGLEIREVASGYRMATKPEYHDAVRGFVKSLKPPLKLSLQALETLAVVAYKQPITAPEVSEIRGVDSGGVLGSLMARKLVTTAGRKQVIGRPILYKTTKDFLLRFGLKDINELPSIEEFEKMAGELAEQEEIPMEPAPEHHAPESAEELEPERHTHLPQADGSPDPVDDPLDDQLPDDEPESIGAEATEEPVQGESSDLVEEPAE